MAAKTFSGRLRIAPVNANGILLGGYIGVLNPVELKLTTPAPDNIDQVSNLPESLGQILTQGQRPKPTSISLSTDDLSDQRVLAYAYNGIVGAYSQAASTVLTTPEVVTVVKLGDWIPLKNRNVSTVVVKDTADTTTYDFGTDYLLDPASGMICPLPGGDIDVGSLHVTYVAAAVTGKTVQVAAAPSALIRVHFQIFNLVDNQEALFVAPICKLSASGDKDFLGKNMLVAALSGAMFIPPVGTPASIETGGAASIITTFDAAA